ncbi:hypothetical protein M8J76_011146 [Diaphorina citri]|nr:hypothetical protein M8J75_008760 [Diaphorina citri]KAI5745445.1 hypothetical protein M8J76_011146 [Diaphorina citri]
MASWLGSMTVGDLFGLFCMHVLMPAAILLEYLVVIPKGRHEYVTWAYDLNFFVVWFLTFNVYSNYYMLMIRHSRVEKTVRVREYHDVSEDNKTPTETNYCSLCEMDVPPRAWHCKVCKVCILNRDHHCFFSATCVGHNNQRYFMCFVFYVWLGISYGIFLNLFIFIEHARLNTGQHIETYIDNTYKYIGYHVLGIENIDPETDFSLLTFDWSSTFIYGGWLAFELLAVIIHYPVSMLLLYSMLTLYKGYPPSRNQLKAPTTNTITNIKIMLGERWYLVWLSAFIPSRLHHDGYSYEKLARKDMDLENSLI